MSYLVLARKYRPQAFATIVGQEHISRALANAIIRERIPHALLLTGPRGVGKTTSARVFARALNCSRRPEHDALKALPEEEARKAVEPCGECANCVDIARSVSLAVWEVDGASNNSVENVREMIESLRLLPPQGSRFKIYIIDEVHMLSTAAFNALLKSLEEPPPNTVFIFATTDPQKIPETVISRCQRFDFRRLAQNSVAEQLASIAAQEGAEIADEVCTLIAEKAQGGMRDAQSMLDRLLSVSAERVTLEDAERLFGFVDRGVFHRLAVEVLQQNTAGCFLILDRVFSQSVDLRAFAGDFVKFWRDLMVLSFAPQKGEGAGDRGLRDALGITSEEVEKLRLHLSQTTSFDLQRLFDLAQKTAEGAIASSYPRYVFEAGIAKMSSLTALRPLAEIVSALEQGLGEGNASVGKASAGTGSAGKGGGAPTAKPSNALPFRAPNPEPRQPSISRSGAEQKNESHPSAGGTKATTLEWAPFVHSVRERGEPVLAAFLRRVTPKAFTLGRVELEAQSFDLVSLKEPSTVENLKRCLVSYTEHTSWEVVFTEQGIAKQNGGAKNPGVAMEHGVAHDNSGAKNPEKALQQQSPVLPGSILAQETDAEKKRQERIHHEVRQDSVVQSALKTFDGSRIEKVSVLKPVRE